MASYNASIEKRIGELTSANAEELDVFSENLKEAYRLANEAFKSYSCDTLEASRDRIHAKLNSYRLIIEAYQEYQEKYPKEIGAVHAEVEDIIKKEVGPNEPLTRETLCNTIRLLYGKIEDLESTKRKLQEEMETIKNIFSEL